MTDSSVVSQSVIQPLQSAGPFVGIDVAKDKLDLARSDSSKILAFDNQPAAIGRLVALMLCIKPALIVVEATGGLERPLVAALLEAQQPVALVNPSQVRHFAKAMGTLAKTDHIDGRVLVEFGQRIQPRLARKRSKNQTELDALVTCRKQLCDLRAAQFNQRDATASKAALKSIDAVIRTMDRQIQLLDEQIKRLIESDDDMNSINKLLRSAPGVGPILSCTLIAKVSELGATGRRSLSALIGVAPFNHDSGKHTGKRSVWGGRADVRSVLYMATVAATVHNPIIKSFYQRLLARGKLKMVALVACMRKLLCLLNAMLKEGIPWDQLNAVKNLHQNT